VFVCAWGGAQQALTSGCSLCALDAMQVKRRLEIKHKLHMSAKDEAIKKASEKTAADPKKAHKWISKELAAKKDKAHVKQLASHKKASSHETKSQKLVEWSVPSPPLLNLVRASLSGRVHARMAPDSAGWGWRYEIPAVMFDQTPAQLPRANHMSICLASILI
jgi:hypothetical protein